MNNSNLVPNKETETHFESDPLNDLARERRAEVEREISIPRPLYVESIDQSEVAYTFNARQFPYSYIDVQRLDYWLRERFAVTLADLDLSPLVVKVSRDRLATYSEQEVWARLVQEPKSRLRWENGRYPTRDDFVAIKSINVNFESIHVTVTGPSAIAEVVIEEVSEQIWEIAGAKKKFTELREWVELTAYATSTRVKLPFGPERLFNPILTAYFDENLVRGSRFAYNMGRTLVDDGGREEELVAKAHLDDVDVRISRFSLSTGYTEPTNVRFSVIAQSDYGTGRLLVTTELPYDKHLAFVEGLIQALHS